MASGEQLMIGVGEAIIGVVVFSAVFWLVPTVQVLPLIGRS